MFCHLHGSWPLSIPLWYEASFACLWLWWCYESAAFLSCDTLLISCIHLGEFRDVYGVEWEEYVHHETSEYFYWTEETNQYQWDKPEIPNRKKGTQELFKLKEEGIIHIFQSFNWHLVDMAIAWFWPYLERDGRDLYLSYERTSERSRCSLE